MTKDYMGVQEWATAAGYTYTRVRNWMNKTEYPEPDVTIGSKYVGWDRDRLPELLAWCEAQYAALDRKAINMRYGLSRGDLVEDSGFMHGRPDS